MMDFANGVSGKEKRMRLTLEEQKICKEYGKRDENNRVHCFECPLVLDIRYCVCKANVTEGEYKEWNRRAEDE
jgi:hypothetical protein